MGLDNFENKLFYFFGEFSEMSFEKFPIWYEYKNPDELDFLNEEILVPKLWLEENFLSQMEEKDEHPYYTLSSKEYLSFVEFSYVKCTVIISGYSFKGYFSIIANELNVLSLFFNEDVLEIYGVELFEDEDIDTLKKLSEFYKDDVFLKIKSIDYILDKSVSNFFEVQGEYKLYTP